MIPFQRRLTTGARRQPEFLTKMLLHRTAMLMCLLFFFNVIVQTEALDTKPSNISLLPYGYNSPARYFSLERDDCPPCFNCMLPAYNCQHFANCSEFDGRCKCPPGFGGDDCSQPVCGSLADGSNRKIREGKECKCADGWSGINCNVCQNDIVCNSLVPTGMNATCYTGGLAVRNTHQMCNVTNRKILDMLPNQPPQVTFDCNVEEKTCGFQFWIDQVESFYCHLNECQFDGETSGSQNSTKYRCPKIQCKCKPGEMLCGKEGSIDISDFLAEEIKGPASMDCKTGEGCKFEEPAMNNLILMVFGDNYISLKCESGECLHYTQVPGFKRIEKPNNIIMITVSVISVIIFLTGAVTGVFYLARKSEKGFGRGDYIRLADDEAAKLMTHHTPATLTFQDVEYYVKDKQILTGVHGIVKPGQVMAIMGASGAGKTSLLDILARKHKMGAVSGEFRVNGQTVGDAQFKRVTGFVDQEDTLMETLTVFETIMYSAMLRLPRDMSYEAKQFRVMETMHELGILGIKDMRIGSSGHRSISGGEKRRVSIACELVTSPSILFLDEPTSGLDAYNAFNVVECLVQMARRYNRTVIFTIHQPRSNIFALFDQLVLMANGHLVYSGDAQRCQGYFEGIGHPCPVGFNIADYLVDLTMRASHPSTFSEFQRDTGEELQEVIDPVTGRRASYSSALRPRQMSISRSSQSSGTDLVLGTTPPVSSGAYLSSTPGQMDDVVESAARAWESELQSRDRRRRQLRLWGGRRDKSRERSQAPKSTLTEDAEERGESNVAVNVDETSPLTLTESEQNISVHLNMLIDAYRRSVICSNVHEEIESLSRPVEVGVDQRDAEDRQWADDEDEVEANTVVGEPQRTSLLSHRPRWSRLERQQQQSFRDNVVTTYRRVSLFTQFCILSDRTFKNLYRDPMLMLTHYCISIFLALLCGMLFFRVTNDIAGFQNRMGVFFFMCTLFGFECLTSLQTFATERILFMRERANGYYKPLPYFLAKILFDILPLRVLPPLLMGVIVYQMVGLVNGLPEFVRFLLVLVLFNLTAASICLCLGVVFRNSAVASLIASLIMLFSMLFGGLLLNKDSIPQYLTWLKDLSFFNYAFEALIVNEMLYLQLQEKKFGLIIDVPGATILSTFGFNARGYWPDVTKLAIMFGVFLVFAFGWLQFFVKERR
ncbi:uncharacterized protein VTP21DRAFT_218 [Calcarisporiella thermophila]|uniref:uncharacterized protein n=1 Tax=Calcarisporiella thermophila TaxID=911321 RepID=UPI003744981C